MDDVDDGDKKAVAVWAVVAAVPAVMVVTADDVGPSKAPIV